MLAMHCLWWLVVCWSCSIYGWMSDAAGRCCSKLFRLHAFELLWTELNIFTSVVIDNRIWNTPASHFILQIAAMSALFVSTTLVTIISES